jgi:uncharacterized protein YlxW (UPF0749 family)
VTDPTTTRERGSAPLPDRVTMPLLTLVTRDAVDEDYVHAARRRAAGGGPPSARWSGHRGAAVVTGIFGLLVALAAVQTARTADVQEASRAALIERIDERNAEVSELEDRIDAVREDTADLQSTDARTRGALAEATVLLLTLQISTGFVAVTGPGVRITVTDNPDGSADGRVRATDLRLLVNGLWQAGAEAIAVNGRRLTTLSSIANSNIAVQVNRVPLTPPYVVTAIGDIETLLRQLSASTSGAEFESLAAQFGFGVERQNEDEVLLPPAPDTQLPLRWAESDTGLPDKGEETTP